MMEVKRNRSNYNVQSGKPQKSSNFFTKPSRSNFSEKLPKAAGNTGSSNFFLESPNAGDNLESSNFFSKSSVSCTTKNYVSTDTTQQGSTSKSSSQENETKKPFDKKLYRLQKYSKKYKLEQWTNKHRRTAMREYHKQIKHNNVDFDVQKVYENAEEDIDDECNLNADVIEAGQKKKNGRGPKDFLSIQEKKAQRNDEMEKLLKEKEEKRKLIRKEKLARFRKLNKRTKKGQPIMKDRIELLLEEIQKKFDDNK